MSKWSELSASEQQEARAIRASLATAGVGATVSQIAKEWDTACAWSSHRITLEQLLEKTGWTKIDSEPNQSRDVPEDPKAAAVYWADRRPRFEELDGVRVLRCTWYLVTRAIRSPNPDDCRITMATPDGEETVWLTLSFRTLDGGGPYQPDDIQTVYMHVNDIVFASITTEAPERGRGRPPVGQKVETRLPLADLDLVDAYARQHNQTRANALRTLILAGLAAEE